MNLKADDNEGFRTRVRSSEATPSSISAGVSRSEHRLYTQESL